MVSIIIVTFNSQEYISKCLDSIKKFEPNCEIIIVDNVSDDETINRIKGTRIPVKLLVQQTNLGYSKANNIGAKNAKGEYLFFLNPDTYLTESITDKLINILKGDNRNGLIAPKMIKPDGKVQRSVRKLPTVKGAVLEYFFGQKNEYEEYFPKGDEPLEVETVYAGAILIKKEIFDSVGMFDEKYFLYFEDLDLCRKLRKFGFKIIYDPKVSLVHQVGGSSKYNPLTKKYLEQSAKIYHGNIKAKILYYILRLHQLVK